MPRATRALDALESFSNATLGLSSDFTPLQRDSMFILHKGTHLAEQDDNVGSIKHKKE